MNPQTTLFPAPADKFFVNSFIVETDDSVVVIDAQFLLSTARALADAVEAKGKPVAGIVVTHPHPDHFNGLPVLLERFGPVPVFANKPTIDVMVATRDAKRAAWTPVYGNDYPTADALPDRVIGLDGIVRVGPVGLQVIDLGAGESADNTVVYVPAADALIASDLVYNRCHPSLAEHCTSSCLEQLERVQRLFPAPERILAGHGLAGGREVFALQREYILQQREAVARHARDGMLDGAGLAAVRAIELDGRAGWPLEGLIDINSAALAAELSETAR
ncbi:MBL fold metallo-hydrolase [Blastomonas sp. UPD001]|uniref:MBL fold metallo-hydrolase n=1 Tax=Blastomonas sp. UPD001 TaxID=2217673 RepID=UPI0013003B0D|nr:MBL fold metallo-hydrolase [Blastomonas sp. UPD001]